MSATRASRVALFVGLTLCQVPAFTAQEEVLFEEADSGELALAGHSRLSIQGFNGTVFVRAGKQDELRYSATTRAALREPHAVALWVRGETIIFRPVAGQETDELILNVALSDGVRLDIDQHGGKIQVASVLADVTVNAVDSEVDIRGAGAGVALQLARGALRLENLTGPTTVEGTGVKSVELNRLSGRTQLTLSESAIEAVMMVGRTLVDLVDSSLQLRASPANVSGRADGSRITLFDVRGGGELTLEQTPLHLENCRGAFEIDTDAEFRFKTLQGSLKLIGFGAAVVGEGHAGEVSVENRDADVSLTGIQGPLTLKGTALRVQIADVSHLVSAELVDSEVRAEKLRGGIDLTNDFGDVLVQAVEGPTKIVNRNGNVHAQALAGSVEIDAEGPEVRVSWREVGRDRDSHIENNGGDLFVVFPSAGGARIEAEADSIETDIEGMRVEEGGQRAQGLVGAVDKPTVLLRASGRLVLSQGDGAQ